MKPRVQAAQFNRLYPECADALRLKPLRWADVALMRRMVTAGVLLTISSPVCAEVMDKEMSVPAIWGSIGVVVTLAVVATLVSRWLLFPSFCVAILFGPTFAWTEWYNDFAGPAILQEAGPNYGRHANAAMSLLVLAHVVGWTVASELRRRQLTVAGRWNPVVSRRSAVLTAIFTGFVATLTWLGAFSGFGAETRILLSPPFLVSVGCCFIAVILAAHTLARRGAEIA